MLARTVVGACIFIFLFLISSARSDEIKVMRGVDLLQSGEDCRLIPEKQAYDARGQYGELLKQSVSLKQMVSEGWKILYMQELPLSGGEFLFLLTRESASETTKPRKTK